MIRVVHPGSGSWLFTHPRTRIPNPGVKKAPGSRIRIRNTASDIFRLVICVGTRIWSFLNWLWLSEWEARRRRGAGWRCRLAAATPPAVAPRAAPEGQPAPRINDQLFRRFGTVQQAEWNLEDCTIRSCKRNELKQTYFDVNSTEVLQVRNTRTLILLSLLDTALDSHKKVLSFMHFFRLIPTLLWSQFLKVKQSENRKRCFIPYGTIRKVCVYIWNITRFHIILFCYSNSTKLTLTGMYRNRHRRLSVVYAIKILFSYKGT